MIGSLGLPEILFILALALLVFGPKRLPQMGRTLGKALGEFRRATNDLKRTVDNELRADLIPTDDEKPATPSGTEAQMAPSSPPETESETGTGTEAETETGIETQTEDKDE